jgi:hypothetical protein
MLCSGLTRPAGRRSAKSRQHRVSPMKGSWPCSPMNIFGNVSAGLEPVGFGLAAKTTTDTDAFSSTSLSTDIFTKHCMGLSFPRRSISTMNAIRQLACIPCTCCESLHKSIYFWETRLTKDLPLERAVIAAMSSQQKIPTSERIKEDAVADNAGAKVSAENRSEAINPWPLSSGNEGLSLPANHGLAFQCSARQSKADTFPNGRFDSGKAQSTRICQWRRNSCLWLRASIALGGQRPPAMGWSTTILSYSQIQAMPDRATWSVLSLWVCACSRCAKWERYPATRLLCWAVRSSDRKEARFLPLGWSSQDSDSKHDFVILLRTLEPTAKSKAGKETEKRSYGATVSHYEICTGLKIVENNA